MLFGEKHAGVIGQVEETDGAWQASVIENTEAISYVLCMATRHIVFDALLGRARACGDARGLELWNSLHSEWKGSTPQAVATEATRYQDPARCTSTIQLQEVPPAWQILGVAAEAVCYPVCEWSRATALHKTVPTYVFKTIKSRTDLGAFPAKQKFFKARVEHERGSAQAKKLGIIWDVS